MKVNAGLFLKWSFAQSGIHWPAVDSAIHEYSKTPVDQPFEYPVRC